MSLCGGLLAANKLSASMNVVNTLRMDSNEFPDLTECSNQIAQLQALLEANHIETQAQIAECRAALRQLITYENGQPMRFANAAARNTVLRGPLGPLPGPIFTFVDLMNATDDQLDALHAHLGDVPDYPTGGPVVEKRRALGDFLGVPVPW